MAGPRLVNKLRGETPRPAVMSGYTGSGFPVCELSRICLGFQHKHRTSSEEATLCCGPIKFALLQRQEGSRCKAVGAAKSVKHGLGPCAAWLHWRIECKHYTTTNSRTTVSAMLRGSKEPSLLVHHDTAYGAASVHSARKAVEYGLGPRFTGCRRGSELEHGACFARTPSIRRSE